MLLLSAVATVTSAQGAGGWPTDIRHDTFRYSNATPTDIPWSRIQQGCAIRDCIVAIDAPRFVVADQARHVDDDDLVMALLGRDEARAYPIPILNYHEIVNDVIDGVPIAVTYCPLCGSGVAYRRDGGSGGAATTFGVSGLLHESDLILYDRATRSLWVQVTGSAFAGTRRGERLQPYPVTMTTWGNWRRAHPRTVVLQPPRGAGFGSKTPYGNYDESRRLLFPVSRSKAWLHPKSVVHGLDFDGGTVAVTARLMALHTCIVLPSLAGLEIRQRSDGAIHAAATAAPDLLPRRMFWFAWYTFHPDTMLVDIDAASSGDRHRDSAPATLRPAWQPCGTPQG